MEYFFNFLFSILHSAILTYFYLIDPVHDEVQHDS